MDPTKSNALIRVRLEDDLNCPETKKNKKPISLLGLSTDVIRNILSFGITHETDREERARQYQTFGIFKHKICPFFNIDTTELNIQSIDTIGHVYVHMLRKSISMPKSIQDQFNIKPLNPNQFGEIEKNIRMIREAQETKFRNLIVCKSLKESTQPDPDGFDKVVMRLEVRKELAQQIEKIKIKYFNKIYLNGIINMNDYTIISRDAYEISLTINKLFSVCNETSNTLPIYENFDIIRRMILESLDKELSRTDKDNLKIFTLFKSIIFSTGVGEETRNIIQLVFNIANSQSFNGLHDRCLPHLPQQLNDNVFTKELLLHCSYDYNFVIDSFGGVSDEERDAYFADRPELAYCTPSKLYDYIIKDQKNLSDILSLTCEINGADLLKKLHQLFDSCSLETKKDPRYIAKLFEHMHSEYFLHYLDDNQKIDVVKEVKSKVNCDRVDFTYN